MTIETPVQILPEVNVEPTGDMMIDWLIDHDKEEPYLDFKESLDISRNSPFPKIVKDIFAFSNFGGGFILIGFRHKSKFSQITEETTQNVDDDKNEVKFERDYMSVGLAESFHIDQATLQERFNAFSPEPLVIDYREFFHVFDGVAFKLALIYVPPSTLPLKPIKDGIYTESNGKTKSAFLKDVILFRRGTQSVPASEQEVSWISKRCQKEQYRLSILSGKTDEVTETIFSNLFEVIRLPEKVWTAMPYKVEEGEESKFNRKGNYRAVYTEWSGQIVTFEDLSNIDSPLHDGVAPWSIESEPISVWFEDEDKKNVLVSLLNREIRIQAYRMGLAREEKKNKFYFECYGESRVEHWKSRFRESSPLTVAQRMWAGQLKRFIFWNLAVIVNFTFVGSRPFLRLNPSLLITEDGRSPLIGSKEGTIITRMTHGRYNSSYLNHVLFWISRLSGARDRIYLARGDLVISAKPCESKLAFGIMADRPSTETMQEEEEQPIIEIAEKK